MRMRDDERWYLAAVQAGFSPREALEERGGDPGRLEHLLRMWKMRRWYDYPHNGDPFAGELTDTGRRIESGISVPIAEPAKNEDEEEEPIAEPSEELIYDEPEMDWPPVISGQ